VFDFYFIDLVVVDLVLC